MNGCTPAQDDEAYAHYDRMTARELFRSAGVSARLYKEFLEPILLVTLFAPGEQLSGERLITPLRRLHSGFVFEPGRPFSRWSPSCWKTRPLSELETKGSSFSMKDEGLEKIERMLVPIKGLAGERAFQPLSESTIVLEVEVKESCDVSLIARNENDLTS